MEYRIAWFKGLTWGYMGIVMIPMPDGFSIKFDWVADKKDATIFTGKTSALIRMLKHPTEKLDLEIVS